MFHASRPLQQQFEMHRRSCFSGVSHCMGQQSDSAEEHAEARLSYMLVFLPGAFCNFWLVIESNARQVYWEHNAPFLCPVHALNKMPGQAAESEPRHRSSSSNQPIASDVACWHCYGPTGVRFPFPLQPRAPLHWLCPMSLVFKFGMFSLSRQVKRRKKLRANCFRRVEGRARCGQSVCRFSFSTPKFYCFISTFSLSVAIFRAMVQLWVKSSWASCCATASTMLQAPPCCDLRSALPR